MTTWNNLYASAQRIDQLTELTPGDIAFLTGPHNMMVAFRIRKMLRKSDGITFLWVTDMRSYQLGGHSPLRFDHALRDGKTIE
ncbi:hypothetical protein [Bifidobacterium biavatii]|uniref:Uncharacterized protein n=1 Tax=Bifidobacterium biavatii DSM 23969 TaxID=1437608 RepID=A0A086ZYX5_9BIFI|nr:hypothetical protein [Bifidobacterium biavatii]KFI51725.1 hypothetical protein BBIA_0639 [Bifidobacterium biavatii DSM 23969]